MKPCEGTGTVDIGAAFRRPLALEAYAPSALEGNGSAPGRFTSALGAQRSWTLPFGLLIIFAVFNRFNPAHEEAARDLGATPWQTLRHVVLPLIGPSLVGIGMFGFTLNRDEVARSSLAMGDLNTLPPQLQGLTTTVTPPQRPLRTGAGVRSVRGGAPNS